MSPTSTHSPSLSERSAPALADSHEAPRRSREGEDGAEPASGPTPTQVLHAMRRRWLVALPLAGATAAIVYLGAQSQLTPVYTARTLVHVGADRRSILYDNVGTRPDTANYQRTQIATVKSRLVRQVVVHDLGPLNLATLRTKADPVGWLEKEIVADYTVAPEILRVTMKGGETGELLLILNAVRDAYLREVVNRDLADLSSRLTNLKDLAAKHDARLKTQRHKLSRLAESFGARDLTSLRVKYEYTTNRVQTLQSEVLLARLEAQRGEAAPPTPKDDPALAPPAVEAALDRAVATDLIAEGLRKEVERLEKKLAAFERRLLNYEADPEYRQGQVEIDTLRTTLTRRRESLRGVATEQLRAAAKLQQPAVVVVSDRPPVTGKHQIALLEAEIQRKERVTGELAKCIAELELLQGEIVSQEEQLALVNSKIRPLDVELQAPPRAEVVEEAVIVETPRVERTLKLAGAPAGIAFFAVLFFVTWLDLRRGRVNGSADLGPARVRVIGALPAVRPNVLPVFALPTQNRARREYLQLTDALDMTRAVIAPVLAAAPGYTLVVTSPAAGEGKTVLSAHLAARFARSGLRTLLIDTDARRPKIDRLLGLKRGTGFGEWASGLVSLSEVVKQGPVPGLDVITAGGCDPQTVADLLDLRFPELLRAAKQEYAIVILDTAPLLSAPDSLALSRLADGVVLSVMRDVSRLAEIRACTERLASINAHVLGAVVTGDVHAHDGSY
ncbi:MAG: capsular exopolysaccharide biosynthesis protein [Gemmataceae bacterium]|nr:capsular exopolysaccharide biosynthesis protein [Gemmataceae bacterium]